MPEVNPPKRIWLLDYGHEDCTWCDDPSPSGEDHSAVEYVRATLLASEHARAARAGAQLAEARAEERERCAEVADQWFKRVSNLKGSPISETTAANRTGQIVAADAIATFIRALTEREA